MFKKLYLVQLTGIRQCMKERREKRRLKINFVTGREGDHRGHEMAMARNLDHYLVTMKNH